MAITVNELCELNYHPYWPMIGERKYISVGQDIIALVTIGLIVHYCKSSCYQTLPYYCSVSLGCWAMSLNAFVLCPL